MKAEGGILASEQPTRLLSLDPDSIKQDFPILKQSVHGRPLIYLDNAWQEAKVRCILETKIQFLNSCTYRGGK